MSQQIAWKYTRPILEEQIPQMEALIEFLEPAVDVGKNEAGEWQFTAFVNFDVPKENIISTLTFANQTLGDTDLQAELEPVYEENWQEKALKDFPPLHVGSFFIHSFSENIPENVVELLIPAGMAFGTGEHPTTSGCLALYEALTTGTTAFEATGYVDTLTPGEKISLDVKWANQPYVTTYKNCLDMGCGSAILAIGVAKKDGITALGVDIDEPSVVVANENAEINNVSNVKCVHGDGFNTPEVSQNKPYDLLFANILMQPLLDMAEDLVSTLDAGGTAILSGFLTEQRAAIETKYTSLGLKVVAEVVNGRWVALALTK